MHIIRLLRQIRRLTKPDPRLSQRLLSAGLWNLVLRVLIRLFSITQTIIVARLLSPSDYGLMGIAMVMVAFLDNFTKTGFKSALIQRQGDIRPYLDTAWTIELLRAAAIAIGLVAIAPLVSRFFDAPNVTPILQVMALGMFISGFINIGMVYFTKELEVHKNLSFWVAEAIAAMGVTVGLALTMRSVWALVYGILAGSVVQVVASYMLHPYRPRLHLDWAKAVDLYKFGRWILLRRIALFLSSRADAVLVGKMLGPSALGLYQIADRVPDFIKSEAIDSFFDVSFPTYAMLQSEVHRLRRAFHQIVEVTASMALPVCGAIVFLAEGFTNNVLGRQWLPAVPVMQVLAIAAAMRCIEAGSAPLLSGVGRPRWEFQKTLVRSVVLLALLYPFIRWWGVVGAALAVLVASSSTLPFHILYTQRILSIGLGGVIRPLLLPVALSAAVMASITLLKSQVSLLSLSGFILATLVSAGVYGGLLFASWRFFKSGPLYLVWKMAARRSSAGSDDTKVILPILELPGVRKTAE
jgi:lipopolysaccharide exporter